MVKRAGGALLLAIEIDHASARPVSTQLYVGAARHDPVRRFRCRRATACNPHRWRATCGVSRTTVIEAFDRLTAEGPDRERASAPAPSSARCSTPIGRSRPPSAAVRRRPARRRSCRRAIETGQSSASASASGCRTSPRAFTTALPAFDAFPMAQWARLAAKHWRGDRNDVMGYGEPCGHPRLRQAIAAHLRANRGIACDAEQIFIVGGAQQAFHLIGSVLLDPGRQGLVREPGRHRRAQQPDRLRRRAGAGARRPGGHAGRGRPAARPEFRLAFVTPSHQQPLGNSHEPGAAVRAAASRRARRAPGSSRTTTTASSSSAAAAADLEERRHAPGSSSMSGRSASRCFRRCASASCSRRRRWSTAFARS